MRLTFKPLKILMVFLETSIATTVPFRPSFGWCAIAHKRNIRGQMANRILAIADLSIPIGGWVDAKRELLTLITMVIWSHLDIIFLHFTTPSLENSSVILWSMVMTQLVSSAGLVWSWLSSPESSPLFNWTSDMTGIFIVRLFALDNRKLSNLCSQHNVTCVHEILLPSNRLILCHNLSIMHTRLRIFWSLFWAHYHHQRVHA